MISRKVIFKWKGLFLVHLADESVDVLLAVTSVTALNKVLELAGVETTSGVGELEGPQEVGGLLEVGADGVNLVDKILNADNTVLAKVLLDDLVVGERETLAVDLAVTALVDELTDGLEVGVTVGNVGVDDGEHLGSSLVQADKDTVVDLEKTQQLQDLAGLGSNLVDTFDTDNKDQLGLIRNVEGSGLAALAGKADLLALCIAVLLDVGLGTLEDDTTLLLVGLLSLLSLFAASGAGSLLALALLEEGLRHKDLVLGRNTVHMQGQYSLSGVKNIKIAE